MHNPCPPPPPPKKNKNIYIDLPGLLVQAYDQNYHTLLTSFHVHLDSIVGWEPEGP